MTDEKLTELLGLLDAATPGCVRVVTDDRLVPSRSTYTITDQGKVLANYRPPELTCIPNKAPADAALDAAARNGLRELIGALREAREALRFYANEYNYEWPTGDEMVDDGCVAHNPILDDRGSKARAALGRGES